MNYRTNVLITSALALCAGFTLAQTPAPAQAPVRTVIAQAKLSSVVEKPLSFRIVSIALKSGQKEALSNTSSIVYQVSGSVDASVNGQTSSVAPDAALYVPAGGSASITAKGGDSNTMVFQLVAAGAKAAESGKGTVKEMYRSQGSLPGLKAGTYDLNLTRVTFPAQMAPNAPHHRTGGAVYYIVSGKGADIVAGKTTEKGPGSFIYEPSALVHQWGNPGSIPLTFLAFNINPEGVPAVAQETPKGKR